MIYFSKVLYQIDRTAKSGAGECLQAACQVCSSATRPLSPAPAVLIRTKPQLTDNRWLWKKKEAVIGDVRHFIPSSSHHFSTGFSISASTAQRQPWKAWKMISDQLFKSVPHTIVEMYSSQTDWPINRSLCSNPPGLNSPERLTVHTEQPCSFLSCLRWGDIRCKVAIYIIYSFVFASRAVDVRFISQEDDCNRIFTSAIQKEMCRRWVVLI